MTQIIVAKLNKQLIKASFLFIYFYLCTQAVSKSRFQEISSGRIEDKVLKSRSQGVSKWGFGREIELQK